MIINHAHRSSVAGVLTLAVSASIAASPLSLPPSAPGGSAAPVLITTDAEVPRVSAFEVQTIALPVGSDAAPATPSSVDVNVVLGTEHVQLRLARHSLRAPTFQLFLQVAGGTYVDIPPPAITTYRGHVSGYPLSAVAASIIDGTMTAHIDLGAGDGTYIVQPASDFPDAGLPVDTHVSFRRADIDRDGFVCGVEDDAVPAGPEPAPSAHGGGGADGSGLTTAEIAIDSDTAFFSDNGLSVAATLADIESIMNATELIYERDVQLTYEITYIIVRGDGATDPYTGNTTSELLAQMNGVWDVPPFSFASRDVAQLFSGRALSGSIGLASVATVCVPTNAYGVVWSTWSSNFDLRVSVTAHELGHNWAGLHCDSQNDCFIMCSVANQCDGTTGANLKFGPASMNSISNFAASRPCLVDHPATLTPPFTEEFPSIVLDTAKWTWTNLTGIVTTAVDPPSPPNALRLFSFGSQPFRDSEIRTNFIDLSGQSDLVVSYSTEHIGVESGETLIVEFRGGDRVWRELNTIVSNGVDQTAFVQHQHDLDLAAEAYHDAFRLRFRVEGDDTGDTWFVDDVYVGPLQVGACCAGELCLIFPEASCLAGGGVYQGHGSVCTPTPCGATPCPEDLSGNGQVDFADILAVIAAWGPCGGCAEDLDGSGDVGFSDVLQIIGMWGGCP